MVNFMNLPRPMLAATGDDDFIRSIDYPVFLTPKVDGVRLLICNGIPYSRSGKPIRNNHLLSLIESTFKDLNQISADGEILLCKLDEDGIPIIDHEVYNRTVSYFNSFDSVPSSGFCVVFFIFDSPVRTSGYNIITDSFVRGLQNSDVANGVDGLYLFPVSKIGILIEDGDVYSKVLQYEKDVLDRGYEGVMINRIGAMYKHGRSTIKASELVKIKRFTDYEARIIGFEEKMTNNNLAELDEFGHTKRSSAKANLEGANTLGALVCTYSGLTFNIGTGFDDLTRNEIWNNKEDYIGKLVKFKSFDIGVKDLPRHPVFIGFRSEDDL